MWEGGGRGVKKNIYFVLNAIASFPGSRVVPSRCFCCCRSGCVRWRTRNDLYTVWNTMRRYNTIIIMIFDENPLLVWKSFRPPSQGGRGTNGLAGLRARTIGNWIACARWSQKGTSETRFSSLPISEIHHVYYLVVNLLSTFFFNFH